MPLTRKITSIPSDTEDATAAAPAVASVTKAKAGATLDLTRHVRVHRGEAGHGGGVEHIIGRSVRS